MQVNLMLVGYTALVLDIEHQELLEACGLREESAICTLLKNDLQHTHIPAQTASLITNMLSARVWLAWSSFNIINNAARIYKGYLM